MPGARCLEHADAVAQFAGPAQGLGRRVRAEAVGYETPGAGGGVRVAGIELGDAEGRLVNDPTHPLADEDGFVRYPDVDLGDQMTQLLVAQRAYQANAAVIERARDAYKAAIGIGK